MEMKLFWVTVRMPVKFIVYQAVYYTYLAF